MKKMNKVLVGATLILIAIMCIYRTVDNNSIRNTDPAMEQIMETYEEQKNFEKEIHVEIQGLNNDDHEHGERRLVTVEEAANAKIH